MNIQKSKNGINFVIPLLNEPTMYKQNENLSPIFTLQSNSPRNIGKTDPC